MHCRTLALTLFAACCVTGPAARPATADDSGAQPAPTTLTVRGSANLSRPPDQIHLAVSVVSRDKDLTAAMDDNSRRMLRVIAALAELGVGEADYETSDFEIEPCYSEPPRYPVPADWKSELLYYEVENSIEARSGDVDEAASFLQQIAAAGADSVFLTFTLKDPEAHRAEAITKAAAEAKRDAQVLADATGVRLVRMTSIILHQADLRPRSGGSIFGDPGEDRGRAAYAIPPPLKARDVDISAAVTIVYEVVPKE
jgi:uncharacterized protein YggE